MKTFLKFNFIETNIKNSRKNEYGFWKDNCQWKLNELQKRTETVKWAKNINIEIEINIESGGMGVYIQN